MNGKLGFGIFNASFLTDSMMDGARGILKENLNLPNVDNFSKLEILDTLSLNHSLLKHKSSRLFPEICARSSNDTVIDWFKKQGLPVEFVTDEENLGYPNFYIRVVRANHCDDVGPPHADRWFWELGRLSFPKGHRRLKIWIPLRQLDDDPGLLIYPGSHLINFSYSGVLGSDGKVRPMFDKSLVKSSLVSAPVKLGEGIIFHDELIHQGSVGPITRVSVEFTLGVRDN